MRRAGGLGRRPYLVGKGHCTGSRIAGTGLAEELDGESEDGGGDRAGEPEVGGAEDVGGTEDEAEPGSIEVEPGSIEAGFNLSTETIIFFPPFRMVKVLIPRSTTSKGPSYGGTRGRRTASTRKKTWEEVARAGSTLVGVVP